MRAKMTQISFFSLLCVNVLHLIFSVFVMPFLSTHPSATHCNLGEGIQAALQKVIVMKNPSGLLALSPIFLFSPPASSVCIYTWGQKAWTNMGVRVHIYRKPGLTETFSKKVTQKAHFPYHLLCGDFKLLLSGKKFSQPKSKNNRWKKKLLLLRLLFLFNLKSDWAWLHCHFSLFLQIFGVFFTVCMF